MRLFAHSMTRDATTAVTSSAAWWSEALGYCGAASVMKQRQQSQARACFSCDLVAPDPTAHTFSSTTHSLDRYSSNFATAPWREEICPRPTLQSLASYYWRLRLAQVQ